MVDLLIKNAAIIDGKGTKAYNADISVKGDRILEINNNINTDAKKVIDINGKYISPGFIDAHSHADLNLIEERFPLNKLCQGVTTEIAGHCGNSLFPVNKNVRPILNKILVSSGINLNIEWESTREFLNRLEADGIGINYMPLTGHGTLRLNSVGLEMKKADKYEIDKMKKYLLDSMEEGSWGLSAGLEYLPGCFADREELRELAKISAKYNGVFTVHLRNQDKNLLESVEEIIYVCKNTGVKTVISHLKASGKENWGKVRKVIELINNARNNGCNIIFDFYPYDASYSFLSIFLPSWIKEGGDEKIIQRLKEKPTEEKVLSYFKKQYYNWENVIISKSTNKELKKFEGLNIATVSKNLGLSQEETVLFFLKNDPTIYALYISLSEEDIKSLVNCPYSIIGSDSFVIPNNTKDTHCHPRNYGTFPRFINKYVKEEKILTIEKAVEKMTGLTAEFYGIENRGVIEKDNYADLVIFDLDKLNDKSNYENPMKKSEGIEYVIINGEIQLEKGQLKNKKVGKILKK